MLAGDAKGYDVIDVPVVGISPQPSMATRRPPISKGTIAHSASHAELGARLSRRHLSMPPTGADPAFRIRLWGKTKDYHWSTLPRFGRHRQGTLRELQRGRVSSLVETGPPHRSRFGRAVQACGTGTPLGAPPVPQDLPLAGGTPGSGSRCRTLVRVDSWRHSVRNWGRLPDSHDDGLRHAGLRRS